MLLVELSPEGLAGFFATTLARLNERQRRLVVGVLAEAFGRGGQAGVVEASAMNSSTVANAVAKVRAGVEPSLRQRVPGGGDRPAIDKQPGLLAALDKLVYPRNTDVDVAVDAEVNVRDVVEGEEVAVDGGDAERRCRIRVSRRRRRRGRRGRRRPPTVR